MPLNETLPSWSASIPVIILQAIIVSLINCVFFPCWRVLSQIKPIFESPCFYFILFWICYCFLQMTRIGFKRLVNTTFIQWHSDCLDFISSVVIPNTFYFWNFFSYQQLNIQLMFNVFTELSVSNNGSGLSILYVKSVFSSSTSWKITTFSIRYMQSLLCGWNLYHWLVFWTSFTCVSKSCCSMIAVS